MERQEEKVERAAEKGRGEENGREEGVRENRGDTGVEER